MMIFMSGRQRAKSLMRVRVISVCSDLSWASSMIMTEQEIRSGSTINSRSSIPSVIYFITVFYEVLSSKRMLQPTSSPNFTPISSLTLAATLMAATLLGWVQPTFPLAVYPSSCRNWGSWVVLPEPVSPTMMIIWLSLIRFMSYSRYLQMGSDSLTSCMGVLYAFIFSAFCYFFDLCQFEADYESLSSSSEDYITISCFLALFKIQFLMNLIGLLMSISQFFLLFSSISSMVLQVPLVRSPWLFYQACESGITLGTSQYRPWSAFAFLSLLGLRSSSAVSGTLYSPSLLAYIVFFSAIVVTFNLSWRSFSSLMVSSELSNISISSLRTAFVLSRITFSRLPRYLFRASILNCGINMIFSSQFKVTPCKLFLFILPLPILSFSANLRDNQSLYSASFLLIISASLTSYTSLSPTNNLLLPLLRSISTRLYSVFFLTSALVLRYVMVLDPYLSNRFAAKC